MGVNVAVGLSHDFSVDASGLSARRGSVVFHRLFHDFYLVLGEPSLQPGVCHENLSTRDVVDCSRSTHSQVVVGSHDIHHVDVGTRDACQLQRVFDYPVDVSESVAFTKLSIFWQDLCFHKLHDFHTYLL